MEPPLGLTDHAADTEDEVFVVCIGLHKLLCNGGRSVAVGRSVGNGKIIKDEAFMRGRERNMYF